MSDPFILAEDRAIKALISDLTVSDEKNPSRPVKVWYGYPDVEVRDQTWPYITIDLVDVSPANDRQHYGYISDSDYRGTKEPITGLDYVYQVPVAYDLMYQLTTYSRHPRHDRDLIYKLLNKFPSKYSYLLVPNQLGTQYTSRTVFFDGFVKRDMIETDSGNRRVLRNVFTLRVASEMTPLQAASAVGQVETVLINATTSHIPSGYEQV
jgi:hypothetical protein